MVHLGCTRLVLFHRILHDFAHIVPLVVRLGSLLLHPVDFARSLEELDQSLSGRVFDLEGS